MEYGCHGCHGYPLACHVGRWISVILWKPYPLVMTNIAVEHCHRNSWFTYLPSKNGDFPVRYVNVYQAGYFSEMQCCCATRGWTSPQDRHPRPLLPEGFPELENDDFHVKKKPPFMEDFPLPMFEDAGPTNTNCNPRMAFRPFTTQMPSSLYAD